MLCFRMCSFRLTFVLGNYETVRGYTGGPLRVLASLYIQTNMDPQLELNNLQIKPYMVCFSYEYINQLRFTFSSYINR